MKLSFILYASCVLLNVNDSYASRLVTRKLKIKEDLPEYMSYESMIQILSIDQKDSGNLKDEWDDIIEDTWDFAFELSEEEEFDVLGDDCAKKTRDGEILTNLLGGGKKVRAEEDTTGGSALFMICYSSPLEEEDEDHENFSGEDEDYDYEYTDDSTNSTSPPVLTSGYQIASQISGQIQSKARYKSSMNTMHALPVYNTEDATCFYGYLQASVAVEFKDVDNVSVTPLPAAFKIRANTFSSVDLGNGDEEDDEAFLLKNETVTIAAQLCPNVGSSDMNAAEIGTSILQEMEFDECWDDADSLRESPMTVHHGMGVYSVRYDLSMDSLKSDECYSEFVNLLASSSTIMSVEKLTPKELFNDHAQWILQSNELDETGLSGNRPWHDAGLKGENQVVAVSDTGLDTEHCYFKDSTGDVVKDDSGTFDLSRRKVVQYYVQEKTDGLDANGHGTHCAGTVAGQRSDNGIDPVTGFGDGVAPDAKLAFFDLQAGNGGLLVDYDTPLFSAGIDAGAQIHSASWGELTLSYGSNDAQSDEFIFDNDDFILMAAAGNSGDDDYFYPDLMMSTGEPATGKNVIAVGATESFGGDLDSEMLGRDYLAQFSSRGPTHDNRIKPDILAPGYWMLSAKTNSNECDPAERPEFGSNKPMGGLSFLRGTSMACPAAAGAGALVHQYFNDGFYPSGAKVAANSMKIGGSLLKAILVNGGQQIIGVNNIPKYDAGVTPSQMYDNNQGFGLINLSKTLPLSMNGTLPFNAFVVDREVLNDQATKSFMFPMCNTTDFRVTLTWFDPPSHLGCNKCLLNDLDLKVKFAATDEPVFYPNGKNSKDSLNNVERIVVSSNEIMEGDVLEVSVSAANLATDMQKFSLAATGCFGEVVKDFTSDPEMKVDPLELIIGAPSIVEKDTPDSLKKMALSELITRHIGNNI
eukprot:CAMPEP_0178964278 /NCGR_PEP_ID=MMETSP0789-20121207/15576_1 /TAXON_ID=3005 /ORGANISM="Rhizosolenia setigera, Strain CCMP 1694" /LENGTH=921 /DNA_ID=CAMNT_0020649011 /DNA_START=39 /DNA_END=2804 /DNA_ORIENTATION=+